MVVVMISPNNFPDGDAGALRDAAFAKIYKALGYDVVIICQTPNSMEGVIDNITYYSMYRPANGIIAKLRRFLSYKERVERCIQNITRQYGRINIFHIYDAPLNTILFLKGYAEKNHIMLLHDSVEWYSPCEFRWGIFDKSYILKNLLNRFIIDKNFKVISISRYLKEHFRRKGCKVIRVPVITTVNHVPVEKKEASNIVKLIYAGSPANKDYLFEVIKGISQLSDVEKERLEFHVFGVNRTQIAHLCKRQVLDSCFQIHGRVPRNEVIRVLRDMDFSLLLRPADERYAKAGFPTKAVEAMSNGVVMMCNISSDLDLYLKDAANAIIVQDATPEALAEAVRRALALSREDIHHLKHAAKKMAIEKFDYQKYVDTMQHFIQE